MRPRKRDEFGLPAGQVAGFAVLFAALMAVLVLFPGLSAPVLGVLLAAASASNRLLEFLEGQPNEELPPASRRFRQLADPQRPLVEGDPASTTPGSTDAAALPLNDARPGDGT